MSVLLDREVARFTCVADANGIQYRIIMPDGTEYEQMNKAQRRQSSVPRGTYVNVFREKCADMRKGERRVISAEGFDVASLRGTLSSAASAAWGNEAHITAIDRENNTVEIMRVA